MSDTAGPPAKRHQIWTLFTFLWVSGAFSSILWSPVFVADAIQQDRLTKDGKITVGNVYSHQKGRRRNADYYTAVVTYEVGNKVFYRQVQGDGAAAERLPIGKEVEILYSPTDPSFVRIDLPDAASSRGAGWLGVGILWSVTAIGAIGAISTRKRQPKLPWTASDA